MTPPFSPGHARCWFFVHAERACACGRPQYIGGLCALCHAGATAVDRALAGWTDRLRNA